MQTDATQLIVHATLWILMIFSILTWSLIVFKSFQIYSGNLRDRRYAKLFWTSGGGMSTEDAADKANAGAMQRLHQVAKAFPAVAPVKGMSVEKCLRDQLRLEYDQLESGLTLLAGIGTTSPFVGLFGTVWGIKRALQDISESGKASLDVVAGPIGEALIATAVGIAVAVPAVLAYNFLTRSVRKRKHSLETFSNDIIDVLSTEPKG